MGTFCLEVELVTNTANSYETPITLGSGCAPLFIAHVDPHKCSICHARGQSTLFLTILVELSPRWVDVFAPLVPPWLCAWKMILGSLNFFGVGPILMKLRILAQLIQSFSPAYYCSAAAKKHCPSLHARMPCRGIRLESDPSESRDFFHHV